MISVILPVRNAEMTIKRSIESVLSQDYNDLELICVINGCTDETESIIKDINDSRIIVTYSKPGIVPALNCGLRIAKGDFIARQDADDEWKPGKLSAQMDFLRLHPEIDILGTQLEVVNISGKFMYNTDYPINNDTICKQLLLGTNSVGHPSVIFRKKVLDKCAGYIDMFPYAEDFDLWIRALMWHKFANLKEVYVTYQHDPNPKYDPRVAKALSTWYRIIYDLGIKSKVQA
jgi:glycosyltransferase involved in cell wall biosynthesis